MADDLELPEWVEWALWRVSLLLVLGGGVAVGVGVAALFGGLKPEFSPLYVLLGGPVAMAVGIGLYVRQTWAILLALVLCLGLTAVCGLSVAADLRAGVPETKSIIGGLLLVVGDLALSVLLFKVVAAGRQVCLQQWDCVVEAVGPGLMCRLQMPNGERAVGWVPRRLARDLSQVAPGDLVWVEGPIRGGYRVRAFPKAV